MHTRSLSRILQRARRRNHNGVRTRRYPCDTAVQLYTDPPWSRKRRSQVASPLARPVFRPQTRHRPKGFPIRENRLGQRGDLGRQLLCLRALVCLLIQEPFAVWPSSRPELRPRDLSPSPSNCSRPRRRGTRRRTGGCAAAPAPPRGFGP